MSLVDNENITAEQIAREGLSALDDKYQKSIGFFAWDFFIAIGKILINLWQKVIYIASCLVDLSKMEYEDLVNFVYQTRGIVAKEEKASSGEITITTGSGTIPKESVFETLTGVRFYSVEEKEVKEGDKILVECAQKGIIGNVSRDSITVIPTTIQGIVGVTNEKDFTNGYEKELKEDLLERYYEDLQRPISSANIYHYKKWAKEVQGVGDAKIKPLWQGDNTVKIVIIDSNREIPSDDLIIEVQNYIDPKEKWGCGMGQAPIGAYCSVVAADKKELSIDVSVVLKSGINLETATDNIRKSVKEYLKSTAFNEETKYISYQKMGAIIMETEGIRDYSNLLINNSTDNILLSDNNSTTEIAVLEELNVLEHTDNGN